MKTYKDCDEEYVFNWYNFKAIYSMKAGEAQKKRIGKEKFREEFANSINVSDDAVKNWLQGRNAPDSIDTIHNMEDILKINRNGLLIKMAKEEKKEKKGGNEMKTWEQEISETKDAVNDIYKLLYLYVTELCEKEGYLPMFEDDCGEVVINRKYIVLDDEEIDPIFMWRKKIIQYINSRMMEIPTENYNNIITLCKEVLSIHKIIFCEKKEDHPWLRDDEEFYEIWENRWELPDSCVWNNTGYDKYYMAIERKFIKRAMELLKSCIGTEKEILVSEIYAEHTYSGYY